MRAPSPSIPCLLLSVMAAATAVATPIDAWRAVPAGVSGDSSGWALAAQANASGNGPRSGAALVALGQFHYARGEYRQAADAFLRGTSRLQGADRAEARYWSGLAMLALGDPVRAREGFRDAAAGGPAQQSLALLGEAQATEIDGGAEKALEAYARVLARDPGEAGAPALSRYADLAEQLHRPDDARRARERLVREYPGSLEAARGRALPDPQPASSAVAVQIGVFADRARADALVAAARKAGFRDAAVRERANGPGGATVEVVILGVYPNAAEAQAAGEKAARALGVSWRKVSP